jgi:ABC-type transport system involved in cytochrome c biogenesis permease component
MLSWTLTNPEVALFLEDLPVSIRQDGENVYKVAFVLLVAVSAPLAIGLNIWMNKDVTFVNISVLLRHRHR